MNINNKQINNYLLNFNLKKNFQIIQKIFKFFNIKYWSAI